MNLFKKKLRRFFNNPRFNGLDFFYASIKHIINNLKTIKHDKLVVTIDHMMLEIITLFLCFLLKLFLNLLQFTLNVIRLNPINIVKFMSLQRKVYSLKKSFYLQLMMLSNYFLLLILKLHSLLIDGSST